jgi:hypothetical protein
MRVPYLLHGYFDQGGLMYYRVVVLSYPSHQTHDAGKLQGSYPEDRQEDRQVV